MKQKRMIMENEKRAFTKIAKGKRNLIEKRKNKERGITLVSLVVTVVILIILSTVTISVVLGDGGLIDQAKLAKDLVTNSSISEAESMNKLVDEFTNLLSEDSEIPEPTPPEEDTIEDIKGGEKLENTMQIKDNLGNIVWIPGEFGVAEDSGVNVEDGIVIEDETGNQFVWVPVGEYKVTVAKESSGKLTNELTRRSWGARDAVQDPVPVNGDDGIDEITGDDAYYGEGDSRSEAKDQIGAFISSATSKGGYYIGRYEAGTETEMTGEDYPSTIPLVQANKYVYNYITMLQAKLLSEAMYAENAYVTSELASSYAWDTALNFMCQNHAEGYKIATTTDSKYGNINEEKEKTGAYTADEYSKIHDMLGNCYEWTTEFSSDSYWPYVIRGGNYDDSDYYAADRNGGSTDFMDRFCSFRLQLYVK